MKFKKSEDEAEFDLDAVLWGLQEATRQFLSPAARVKELPVSLEGLAARGEELPPASLSDLTGRRATTDFFRVAKISKTAGSEQAVLEKYFHGLTQAPSVAFANIKKVYEHFQPYVVAMPNHGGALLDVHNHQGGADVHASGRLPLEHMVTSLFNVHSVWLSTPFWKNWVHPKPDAPGRWLAANPKGVVRYFYNIFKVSPQRRGPLNIVEISWAMQTLTVCAAFVRLSEVVRCSSEVTRTT